MIFGLSLLSVESRGQNTGSIKGLVIDASTNKSLPGASVYIKTGSNLIGTTTDLDGYFTLKPLEAGSYNLHVTYMGYGEQVKQSVRVLAGQITYIENVMMVPGLEAPTFTLEADPLIRKDGGVDKVIRFKQIEDLPDSRNLMKIITAISSDIVASDNERDVSFRGARVGDATMVVDGMVIRGTESGLPGGAISSVVVYTGGIPAKYGDTTGGVVVIQTKSYFEWESERRMREEQ